MEKKNIDWANLGFGNQETDKRFVANYKNNITKYVRMKNGKLAEHFDREN